MLPRDAPSTGAAVTARGTDAATPRGQVRRAPRRSSPSRRWPPSASSATPGLSLREIAQNSEFSHGVVHYYFADKIELITYCVRYYKAQLRDALRRPGRRRATTAEELPTGFADKLVETLHDEAPMHRLWYDLRTQSMFEDELPRGRARDRPHPGADDLAGRPPLRRAARRRAGVLVAHRRTRCSTGCSRRPCSTTWPATPVAARRPAGHGRWLMAGAAIVR